ncbi:MAG: hypothetical protein WBL62_00785 [Gallionella sp.]
MINDSEKYELPEHFQALQSCLRKLNLDIQACRSGRAVMRYRADFSVPLVRQHLSELEGHVHAFDKVFNHSLSALFVDTAPISKVNRALHELTQAVTKLIVDFDNVAASWVADEHVSGWQLLVDIYAHTLAEVHEMVIKLLDFLADPMGYLQRRGLPTRGKVNLTLVLTFTCAPQLPDFEIWMRNKFGCSPVPVAMPPASNGMGLWHALAIGWLLGEWLGD